MGLNAQQAQQAQLAEQAKSVIVTTGDLPAKYQPMKIVFAIGGSQSGVFKAASPQEAFERATQSLQAAAATLGGHAVVYCSFGYTAIAQAGCGGSAFTVHGYGTVVRFT